jgi:hypothetical protein
MKTIAVGSLAVFVCLCGASCGVSNTAPRSSGATAEQPSASVVSALENTFASEFGLLPECPAVTVQNSELVATDKATGDKWAVASFAPSTGCQASINGIAVPVGSFGIFASNPTPKAVFLMEPGKEWSVTSTTSTPWPCPPKTGQRYGVGTSYVPKDVLQVWGLKYADGCGNETPGHEPRQ